jgi:hypothetical protein
MDNKASIIIKATKEIEITIMDNKASRFLYAKFSCRYALLVTLRATCWSLTIISQFSCRYALLVSHHYLESAANEIELNTSREHYVPHAYTLMTNTVLYILRVENPSSLYFEKPAKFSGLYCQINIKVYVFWSYKMGYNISFGII